MQSYLTAVIFYSFALAILLCVFFGCDNAPRVRLVKDDDETFHFQWAEPLKEERIILVRRSGVTVSKYRRQYIRRTPFNRDVLIYFPSGAFISDPVWQTTVETSYEHIAGEVEEIHNTEYIGTVEILPADLRETVLLADVYEIRGMGFRRRYEHDRILREYPLFRKYRVDQLSHLTFELPPGLRDEPDSQGWRRFPPPPPLRPPSILPSFETDD